MNSTYTHVHFMDEQKKRWKLMKIERKFHFFVNEWKIVKKSDRLNYYYYKSLCCGWAIKDIG